MSVYSGRAIAFLPGKKKGMGALKASRGLIRMSVVSAFSKWEYNVNADQIVSIGRERDKVQIIWAGRNRKGAQASFLVAVDEPAKAASDIRKTVFEGEGQSKPTNTQHNMSPTEAHFATVFSEIGAAAKDPLGQIPGTSTEGSKIIHSSIDQIAAEFGANYRLITGKEFEHETLLGLGYLQVLKQLGFLVDWLLKDESASFAVDDFSRNEAVANLVPGWDIMATSLQTLADLDMLFRVAAVALDSADSDKERKRSNAWFNAASKQLTRLESLAT